MNYRIGNARGVLVLTLGTLSLLCGLSAAWAQETGLPAKPPGVVRIGIVKPKVKAGADEAPQAADAVRNILAEYLQGPTMEVALLSARLPSQYTAEAQQADCDFVLATTLVHRRGSQNSALGQTLGKIANYTPYIPGGDYAQSAMVTGALQTAADFATSVKAKDEMQLDYRLHAVGAEKPVLEKGAKQRAKSDGEDLLTPLVEGAAEAIGAAVTTKASE